MSGNFLTKIKVTALSAFLSACSITSPNDDQYTFFAGPAETDKNSVAQTDFNTCHPEAEKAIAKKYANNEIYSRRSKGDDFSKESIEQDLFKRMGEALEKRTAFYEGLLDCETGDKKFRELAENLEFSKDKSVFAELSNHMKINHGDFLKTTYSEEYYQGMTEDVFKDFIKGKENEVMMMAIGGIDFNAIFDALKEKVAENHEKLVSTSIDSDLVSTFAMENYIFLQEKPESLLGELISEVYREEVKKQFRELQEKEIQKREQKETQEMSV